MLLRKSRVLFKLADERVGFSESLKDASRHQVEYSCDLHTLEAAAAAALSNSDTKCFSSCSCYSGTSEYRTPVKA